MIADPKPQRRFVADSIEWTEIRADFRGESCWVCGGRWTELHHLLARSHSGDDHRENLIPLCSECHRKVEARDPTARSYVRQALMPSNLEYLRGKLGERLEGWLERNYSEAVTP